MLPSPTRIHDVSGMDTRRTSALNLIRYINLLHYSPWVFVASRIRTAKAVEEIAYAGELQMEMFACMDCALDWEAESATKCPRCKSKNLVRLVHVLEE